MTLPIRWPALRNGVKEGDLLPCPKCNALSQVYDHGDGWPYRSRFPARLTDYRLTSGKMSRAPCHKCGTSSVVRFMLNPARCMVTMKPRKHFPRWMKGRA